MNIQPRYNDGDTWRIHSLAKENHALCFHDI